MWQLEHWFVATVCVWLKLLGVQRVVVWQLTQLVTPTGMCVVLLPVAVVPLWQVEQPVVMPACENVAGLQAAVVWQLLQFSVVGT